jgi:hypothetical protein
MRSMWLSNAPMGVGIGAVMAEDNSTKKIVGGILNPRKSAAAKGPKNIEKS